MFHFVANLFALEVVYRQSTPEEAMRELRTQGLSLSDIAHKTGSTMAVVRRVVGKIGDQVEKDRRANQEAIATAIDAEPLTFAEKGQKWKAATGQSEVTFWRVLKRTKQRNP